MKSYIYAKKGNFTCEFCQYRCMIDGMSYCTKLAPNIDQETNSCDDFKERIEKTAAKQLEIEF